MRIQNIFLSLVTLLVCSPVASSVSAQDLSTLGNRTILCVKRVGKTADGSKNRGRDAFMNPGPCPKGYFSIDILALSTAKTASGPQGSQGPVGPQGASGPGGGTIFGRLISCDAENESYEGSEYSSSESGNVTVTTPCDAQNKQESKHGGKTDYEVFIPGNSFLSRTDNLCMFRLNNVPAGTYDLTLGKTQGKGRFVKGIKGVVVNEGTATSVGDIPVCRDLDDDGFDITNDCDDSNTEVNPSAAEVCDGIDNNCNGVTDEGCSGSSSSSSSLDLR